MSPESASEGAAPAYDAAERGTIEVQVHLGPSSITLTNDSEKKVETPLTMSKEVIPTPKPSTTKPPAKKNVSKWIVWQLWFNTYRYLSIVLAVLDYI